jgi:hypothetical protein
LILRIPVDPNIDIFLAYCVGAQERGVVALRDYIAEKGIHFWVVQTEGGKRDGDWDGCMSDRLRN